MLLLQYSRSLLPTTRKYYLQKLFLDSNFDRRETEQLLIFWMIGDEIFFHYFLQIYLFSHKPAHSLNGSDIVNYNFRRTAFNRRLETLEQFYSVEQFLLCNPEEGRWKLEDAHIHTRLRTRYNPRNNGRKICCTAWSRFLLGMLVIKQKNKLCNHLLQLLQNFHAARGFHATKCFFERIRGPEMKLFQSQSSVSTGCNRLSHLRAEIMHIFTWKKTWLKLEHFHKFSKTKIFFFFLLFPLLF